jgi:hypothetical protein
MEQEEDTLMSAVLMVLLQHGKFQAPALITDILRGKHCLPIEMMSLRIHFTFGWSPSNLAWCPILRSSNTVRINTAVPSINTGLQFTGSGDDDNNDDDGNNNNNNNNNNNYYYYYYSRD